MKKIIAIGSYENYEMEFTSQSDFEHATSDFIAQIKDIYGKLMSDDIASTPSYFTWQYNDDFQAIYISDEPNNVIGKLAEIREKMAYCVDWICLDVGALNEYANYNEQMFNILEALKGGKK